MNKKLEIILAFSALWIVGVGGSILIGFVVLDGIVGSLFVILVPMVISAIVSMSGTLMWSNADLDEWLKDRGVN